MSRHMICISPGMQADRCGKRDSESNSRTSRGVSYHVMLVQAWSPRATCTPRPRTRRSGRAVRPSRHYAERRYSRLHASVLMTIITGSHHKNDSVLVMRCTCAPHEVHPRSSRVPLRSLRGTCTYSEVHMCSSHSAYLFLTEILLGYSEP